MTETPQQTIERYCEAHGMTDLHRADYCWRAFPPAAVMSVPIDIEGAVIPWLREQGDRRAGNPDYVAVLLNNALQTEGVTVDEINERINAAATVLRHYSCVESRLSERINTAFAAASPVIRAAAEGCAQALEHLADIKCNPPQYFDVSGLGDCRPRRPRTTED